MNESFIFYASFAEAIKSVPVEHRLQCYEALTDYALTGEYDDTDVFVRIIMAQAVPQIDANFKRRENGIKGAEFGKKGGRPKKNPIGDNNKNPIGVIDENPTGETTETPNVNDNVNVECINDNDNVDKEKDNTSIIPKEKKEQTAEFREALINLGVETDIADELMLIRKKKKAINTKHAFEMMLAEANKAGITLAEAVKICVDNQWKGFKAEYLQGLRERNSRGGGRGHTLEEMARIVDAGIALNDILGTRNEKERRGETWNSTGR